MTIGNVTAMTAFVGMTRPPQQVVPADPAAKDSVQLGYQIFNGNSSSANASLKSKLYQNMCANCHVPSLPLNDPTFKIDTPLTQTITRCPKSGQPFPPASATDCPDPSSYVASRGALVTPLKSAQDHPEIKKLRQSLSVGASAMSTNMAPAGTLWIPLSPAVSKDYPDYIYPRLLLPFFPAMDAPPAGSLGVPLFSDLRRHNMGKFLTDRMDNRQGSDIAGLCIAEPLFLTRPLWGVADTGPWLHDGRALTLMDAIMFHGDTASQSGSEAALVIDAFEKLSPAEQQAVVDFLLTLRLPLQQGLLATN